MAGIFGDVSMNGAEPAALDRLNNLFLMMGYHHPILVNLVMVGVMAVLAWGYWSGRIRGPMGWLTIVWLAFVGIVPQAMATLLIGTATDLGNAFPVGLLPWTAKHMLAQRILLSRLYVPR